MLTLARWLGPWADATKAPQVPVRDHQVAGLRVRVFGEAGTPYLVAPGLHYAGPDDPRMDRFCRILAAAGHHVAAPFIPGYLALTPGADAIADFIRVFDAIAFTQKPVVFSISFGSLLAFALAAARPDAIERLVIFGGYSDFHATMRYCLTGEGRDPLNQPVVLMNLLEHIAPHLAGDLRTWWREYVTRTWGRPEMKARDRFVAVAEELAPSVPEAARELFLVGIGARPGAWEIADAGLARFDASALDPAPYLSQITSRVDLLHGTDDDVIPYTQSLALARQLADAHVHITGMYGHTGAQRPPLSAAARELVTMVRALLAMS